MTTYQSPDHIITIEVEDGQVTDVLIATGRRFRDGELEAAISHVLDAALDAQARPAPLSQQQLDQIDDITLASERMSAEAHALVNEMAARLSQLELPSPPRRG